MTIAQVKSVVLPMLLATVTVAAGVVVAAAQLSGGTQDGQTAEQATSQVVTKAKRAGNQGSQQTAKTKVSNAQSQPQSNQAVQGPATARPAE